MKPPPSLSALVLVTGAVLLAGCSGGENAAGEGSGKVSAEEAAAKARDIARPEPGLYRTTVTMTGLEIPGLPPEMEGHGAGLTTTTENCLTKEAVAEGYGELVKQGQNGDCSFERFDVAGGKIDAVMACKAQGRDTRAEITGATTKTGAELTAKMAMDFEGAGGGTMTFTSKHERIGECPAK